MSEDTIFDKEEILRIFDELFDDAGRDYGSKGLHKAYIIDAATVRLLNRDPIDYRKIKDEISNVFYELEHSESLASHEEHDGYYLWERKVAAFSDSSESPRKANVVHAVNNHVCPTCGNDRVNKQEKSCWKCGSSLAPSKR